MKRDATECRGQTQATFRKHLAESSEAVMTTGRMPCTTQFELGYGVARTVGRESRRFIQALTHVKSLPIFAW